MKGVEIIDPFNKEHIFLVRDYDINIYNEIASIVNNSTKEEYEKSLLDSIVYTKYFIRVEDDKIKDFIQVTIQKDIKRASMYPNIKKYNKDLIPYISNYLINNLDMEEVFVFIKKTDTKNINNLIEQSFISLGDDGEYIPLLIEKDNEKESKYGVIK